MSESDGAEQRLLTIDREILTPLLRDALSNNAVDVTDWEYLAIYGGYGGGKVYRFTGNARDGGENIEWSLVLKIIPASIDSDHPFISSDSVTDMSAINREPLVYQSGFLNDLPYGLAAPRCFGVVEHPDGIFWLWLEDVEDEIGHWPLERYGFVAHQFGQLGGSYLMGLRIPPATLINTDNVQGVESVFTGRDQLRDSLDHPLVRCACPADLAHDLIRLLTDYKTFIDVLDGLPQIFCHNDVHRGNMFARRGTDGSDETVVIDWQLAGMGAIGGEMGAFISDLFVLDPVPGAAQERDRTIFDGYLAGLRDVGWRGHQRIARFGCLAISLLRWVLICPGMIMWYLDEGRHAELEKGYERPMEEIMGGFANSLRFHLKLADEARMLLDSIR